MEDRTCKTCKDNDNGLCDRKGILVEDEMCIRDRLISWFALHKFSGQ